MDEILPLLAIRADERVENTNRSRVGSVAATASMSAFDRGQHGMEQHFVHTYLALRDLTLETNLIGRASSLSSLLMQGRRTGRCPSHAAHLPARPIDEGSCDRRSLDTILVSRNPRRQQKSLAIVYLCSGHANDGYHLVSESVERHSG